MDSFNPVAYSIEENQFLAEHLGKPPVVAMKLVPETNAISKKAVREALQAIYDLEETRKHGDPTDPARQWVGVEALRQAIAVYLREQARWAADKRKGAPRFPSMSSFDGRGRPQRQGPGSDSGVVSTYFGPGGERLPFAVELIPSGFGKWVADWATEAGKVDQPAPGLKRDDTLNRLECFCGHTEKFDPESRISYRNARGRMSRHMRKPKDGKEVEKHLEVYTLEYRS